jgi:uncharacterized membrane protein HdeD (DUF308 family)
MRTFGIVLLVLGVASIVSPAVAGAMVSLIVGVLLLTAGLSKIVRIFSTKRWKEDWEDVLLGVLAIVAGSVVIARPLVGLSAITLSLVCYFAASGVLQSVWWWRLRGSLGSLWMLLAAISTLLLAVLIAVEWPLSGLWAVGTLVGIHLLFGGASLIALAPPARKTQAATGPGASPAEEAD